MGQGLAKYDGKSLPIMMKKMVLVNNSIRKIYYSKSINA
jgi:hypothetical protein